MNLRFQLVLKQPFIFELLASVVLGIAVFCYYFDFSILDPANTAWMKRGGGDALQHYLGSYAFRTDSWHFPITKTTLINYPEGVSIVYTDSNPLLSLISKVFRGIFPPEYQFFGFWYLLCWILQSLFGYLIVKKVTNNPVYALLGGLLFCLLPTQIYRVGHANLVAFWLILWTLYIFINNRYTDERKWFLFFTVFLISAMVHAYLSVMCIIIGGTWLIQNGLELLKEGKKRRIKKYIISNSVCFLLFLVSLWCLGYFYNNPVSHGLLGFGGYSMNLLSPFNPFNMYLGSYSLFMPDLVVNEAQYEGFQYMGLGIIVLFLLAAGLIVRDYKFYRVNKFKITGFIFFLLFILFYQNERLSAYEKSLPVLFILIFYLLFRASFKENRKLFFLLIIPAAVCFFIALSNKIYIGKFKLLEIELEDDGFYAGILRSIRSSGRFFWVTIHVLLLLAVFYLYNFIRSGTARLLILTGVIVIQAIDLSKAPGKIDSNNREYISPLSEENKELILASSSVKFLGEADMRIAEFALLNKRRINNFNTVHHAGIFTAKKLEKERKNFDLNKRDSSLYLFQLKDIPENIEVPLPLKFNNDYFVLPPVQFALRRSFVTLRKQKYDSLSAIVRLIETRPVVVIAVCDEAALSLSSLFRDHMDNTFGTGFRKVEFRHSYLTVFVNGKLHKELWGPDKQVDFSENLLGYDFFVRSAGGHHGSVARIRINDQDVSLNDRGLNVVAFTPGSGGTFSCIASSFDTHGQNFPF